MKDLLKKTNRDLCDDLMQLTLYDRRHAVVVLKQPPDEVVAEFPVLLRPMEVY